MSDFSTQELDEIQPDEHNDPALIKRLRDQVKGQGKIRSELETAKRELAFRRAGVDVETRLGKLLMDGWTEGTDDIEAIKTAWNELPHAASTPPPASAEPVAPTSPEAQPAPGAPAEPPAAAQPEPTGTEQRQALATDPTPAGTFVGDATQHAIDQAHKAQAEGATWDDAAGGLASLLVNNTHQGITSALTRDGERPGRR